MSWKASGYVKELRDGLSVTDKFVLLILAEYHSTEEKASWPSVATLADDCLMTVRGVQQILSRLEAGDFIARTKGCGRGNVSGYQIIGVDIQKVNDERHSANGGAGFIPEKVHGRARKGERKGEPRRSAIRKEPLEPEEPIKPKAIAIPEWVPVEPWEGFIEMRRKMRNAPLTDRAIKMLLGDLADLRQQGENPEEVLNVATKKGWRGLFAVSRNSKGKGIDRHEQQRQRILSVREQAHEILRREEAANQQDTMDYGQATADVHGDEQTGAKSAGHDDDGEGFERRVIRRTAS